MLRISVAEARSRFAEVLERSKVEAVVVERRGEPASVVIAFAEYERLVEVDEENRDIAAFDAAMSEEGENIPWDEVKKELGWA